MTKTSTSNNYEQEEDRILSVASPTTEEGTLLSKVSIEIHQVSSNPNKDHHGINPTGDEPREEEKTEQREDQQKMTRYTTITFCVWSIASAVSVAAWVPSATNFNRQARRTLCVLSEDVSETTEEVPYVIARGDGSTGGGGLPMPNREKAEDDETEELRRPKVNGEMPKG